MRGNLLVGQGGGPTAVINASLLGALVTIIFFIIHKMRKGSGHVRVPYGVAISLAGLWCAGEQFFNHFR